MSELRKEKKEQTRKRILGVAYQLYIEKGFSVTAKEIAERAEIAQGTIFVHFPTVTDLIAAVVGEYSGKLMPKLHTLSRESPDIRAFLGHHIDVLAQYEDFYFRLITQKSLLPLGVQEDLVCIQSAVAHHLNEVIKKNKGIKDLPIYFIFNCWTGLLHYYIENKDLFTKKGSVLQKHREELIENYMKMICV